MSKRGLEHLIPVELDFQCESANILVVDDDPLTTKFVQVVLAQAGFHKIQSVHNPLDLMETLAYQSPDLILLDIEMPHKNGLELLQEIRANPELKDVSVVILSGADKASKYRSLQLGAADFIDKPVDAEELKLRVRKALRVI